MDLPHWSVEDLAAFARLHPETVRAHIRQGRLKAFKIGRRWLMCDDDVDTYLRSVTSPPPDSGEPDESPERLGIPRQGVPRRAKRA